jgi:uncharacterized lipoprotein YddW (UPF0748 family)
MPWALPVSNGIDFFKRLITLWHMLFILLLSANLDFRGVWIPRWSLGDQQKIFKVLDGRFNHIFLQVFANGEAYYPSVYAPSKRSSGEWLVDFIAEAHQRNIKVSAWVNVFYSWGYAPPPLDAKHPMVSHPEWYVVDRGKNSILACSTDELERMEMEGYYISPANPAVRNYLISVIMEIINTYDFDGIHLDYVRYPKSIYKYDDALRTKFMREYYIDPLSVEGESVPQERFGLWGCSDISALYASYIQNDLSLLIRDIGSAIRNAGKGVYLSAAVKPDYAAARDEYYQDWLAWLNAGYLDFACLMAYQRNIEHLLVKVKNAVREPERIMVGLGLYNQPPEVIGRQVSEVSRDDFGGVVFFSYEELKKNRTYLSALQRSLSP